MCFAYCSLDNMNKVIRLSDKPKGNKYIKLVFTNKPILNKSYILHELYYKHDMIKRIKVYTNHEFMNTNRMYDIIKMILVKL